MQVFQVKGMTCNHCVRAVAEAVKALDAGAAVDIDLASGTLKVDGSLSPEQIRSAVIDEGYEVIGG